MWPNGRKVDIESDCNCPNAPYYCPITAHFLILCWWYFSPFSFTYFHKWPAGRSVSHAISSRPCLRYCYNSDHHFLFDYLSCIQLLEHHYPLRYVFGRSYFISKVDSLEIQRVFQIHVYSEITEAFSWSTFHRALLDYLWSFIVYTFISAFRTLCSTCWRPQNACTPNAVNSGTAWVSRLMG